MYFYLAAGSFARSYLNFLRQVKHVAYMLLGGAPEGFPWADNLWECNCCLDMAKLEAYVQDGRDARQDQLEQFFEVARSQGRAADAGLTVLKHVSRLPASSFVSNFEPSSE